MTCGVVVPGWYMAPGCPPVRLELPGDVGELVAACPGATSLLVHKSALRWLRLPARLPKRETRPPFIATPAGGGEPLSWRVMVRVGSRVVPVVFLGYDDEGNARPWVGEPADAVAAGLRLFEQLVGVPWRDSRGRTAERLILSTHPRERGGTLLAASPVTPPPCEDGAMEQPYRWRRALMAGERHAPVVHTFDQNAQYLSAWQTCYLGVGDPVKVGGAGFELGVYGVWRTEGNPDPVRPFDPARYERPQPDVSAGDWRMGVTLERWSECVSLPVIREGYVWPSRTRYLRTAAERLRDARATLLEAPGRGAALALEAVKWLYRVETGRFNMSYRDERSPWRRPDFGHAIRATARVNLNRRLAKLGASPFAVDVDGLAFFSDEPDPARFAAAIGLPVGTGLGQFSIEHTVKATDEIRTAASAAAVFRAIREAADDA